MTLITRRKILKPIFFKKNGSKVETVLYQNTHPFITPLLTAIQGMAETHLHCVREGAFPELQKRLEHAELIIEKSNQFAASALKLSKKGG